MSDEQPKTGRGGARKGAGRPKGSGLKPDDEARRGNLNVRLPDADSRRAAYAQAAAAAGKSMSEWVIEVLDAAASRAQRS